MKILFFIEGHYRGGVVTFLINLINNWPVVSDDVVLLCNASNPAVREFGSRITRPYKLSTYDIMTFMRFFNKPHKKDVLL